jgi:outer membrane protein assembly factor BamB
VYTKQLVLQGSILIAVLISLLTSSCSKIAPLTPTISTPESASILGSNTSGNHQLWGEYYLILEDKADAGALASEYSVELVPIRTSENHNNITVFVIPPKCADCMSAEIVSVIPGDPTSEFTIKITLSNKTKFVGQDVRGIIFPSNPVGGCILEDADGLTTLYETVGKPPNPYMAFYDQASSAPFRPFPKGESRSANYKFLKANTYKFAQIVYKIDASYPTPAEEPVKCDLLPFAPDDHIYPIGSHATLQVRITDWQNDVSTVSLDLSSFKGLSDNEAMTKVSEDLTKYTSVWSYKLSVPAQGAYGPRPIRLTALSGTPLAYFKDVIIDVTEDTDPPIWNDPNKKGIFDSISGPDALTLFFYEAWDPTFPIQYQFYTSLNTPVPFDNDHLQKIYYLYWNSYFFNDSDFPMNTPNKVRYYAIGLQDGNGYFAAYKKYFKAARYTIDPQLSYVQSAEDNPAYGSPVIGDVNGDGQKDIAVCTSDGKIHVYDGKGTGSAGIVIWEYQTGGAIYCTPALVDLNGDKKCDVVAVSDDLNVYAIDGSTGLPLWQPHPCGPGDFTMHGSPAIAQLNTGAYDIIVGTGDGRMLALDGDDGSEIWSFVTTSGKEIDSSPGVADVNGDGVPDVCFASNDNFIYMVDGATGKLIWSYVTDVGSNCAGSSPVMADLNADGVPDPVFGYSASDGTGRLVAFDGSSTGPGVDILWTQDGFFGSLNRSIAPVKINEDEVWDFIVSGGAPGKQKSYYAVDGANGNIIYSKLSSGLDAGTNYNYTAPVVGDFTADGHMKAIFGRAVSDVADGNSFISLVNLSGPNLPSSYTGKELKQIQVASGNNSEIVGVPAVDDVNGDGALDLVACTLRGDVYILNMHAPVPADIQLRPWTCNQGNRWANGIPEFPLPDE